MNGKILVADDDAELLDSMVTFLSDAGATVTSATTGADLLEQVVEKGPFDLLITDDSMPWMTGYQVLCSMREAGLQVPIIMITGLANPSLVDRLKSFGKCVTLLRKPFDVEALRVTVEGMLGSQRGARAEA